MNKKMTITAINSAALLIGIDYGGFQYVIYKIACEFSLSGERMGTLVSVVFVAILLASLITGPFSDVIGKKKMMLFTLIMVLMGAVLCICVNSIFLLTSALFVIGFAIGGLENAATAELSDLDIKKSGKNISRMHGIVSLGCCIAPLLIKFLMQESNLGWRSLYWVCIIISIISLFIVMISGVKNQKQANKVKEKKKISIKMIVNIYIITLLINIIIYTFMENGLTYFTDMFLSTKIQMASYSAITLSIFWIFMTLGRFISSMLYLYENKIIIVCLLVVAISFIGLAFSNNIALVIITYGILGFFSGPIWPLITSKINREFRGFTGLSTGFVMVLTGGGGVIAPLVMGRFSDTVGLSFGFVLLGIMAVVGSVLYMITCKVCKN